MLFAIFLRALVLLNFSNTLWAYDSGSNDITFNGSWSPADGTNGVSGTPASGTSGNIRTNHFQQNVLTTAGIIQLSYATNIFEGATTFNTTRYYTTRSTNNFYGPVNITNGGEYQYYFPYIESSTNIFHDTVTLNSGFFRMQYSLVGTTFYKKLTSNGDLDFRGNAGNVAYHNFADDIELNKGANLEFSNNTFSGNIVVRGGFYAPNSINTFASANSGKTITISKDASNNIGYFYLATKSQDVTMPITLNEKTKLQYSLDIGGINIIFRRVNVMDPNVYLHHSRSGNWWVASYARIDLLDLSALTTLNFVKICASSNSMGLDLFNIKTLISSRFQAGQTNKILFSTNGSSFTEQDFVYSSGKYTFLNTSVTPNVSYSFTVDNLYATMEDYLRNIDVTSGLTYSTELSLTQDSSYYSTNTNNSTVTLSSGINDTGATSNPIYLTLDRSAMTDGKFIKLALSSGAINLTKTILRLNDNVNTNSGLLAATVRNVFCPSYAFTSKDTFASYLANYFTLTGGATFQFKEIHLRSTGSGSYAEFSSNLIKAGSSGSLSGVTANTTNYPHTNATVSVTTNGNVGTSVGDAPVTLTRNCTVTVDAGKTLTANGTITVPSGITMTKAGAGTFAIDTATFSNTSGGALTVTGGTVRVGAGGSISGTVSLNASTNLTLSSNATVNTVRPLSTDSTIEVSPNSISLYPTITTLNAINSAGDFPKIVRSSGAAGSKLFHLGALNGSIYRIGDPITLNLSGTNSNFTFASGQWSNGTYTFTIGETGDFDSSTNDITYNGSWTDVGTGTPLSFRSNRFRQSTTIDQNASLINGINVFNGTITIRIGNFNLTGSRNIFPLSTSGKTVDISSTGALSLDNRYSLSVGSTINLLGTLNTSMLEGNTNTITFNRLNITSSSVFNLNLMHATNCPTMTTLDLSRNDNSLPKIYLSGVSGGTQPLFAITNLISSTHLSSSNITIPISTNGTTYTSLTFTHVGGNTWRYTSGGTVYSLTIANFPEFKSGTNKMTYASLQWNLKDGEGDLTSPVQGVPGTVNGKSNTFTQDLTVSSSIALKSTNKFSGNVLVKSPATLDLSGAANTFTSVAKIINIASGAQMSFNDTYASSYLSPIELLGTLNLTTALEAVNQITISKLIPKSSVSVLNLTLGSTLYPKITTLDLSKNSSKFPFMKFDLNNFQPSSLSPQKILEITNLIRSRTFAIPSSIRLFIKDLPNGSYTPTTFSHSFVSGLHKWSNGYYYFTAASISAPTGR
jgi:hypothetical protein